MLEVPEIVVRQTVPRSGVAVDEPGRCGIVGLRERVDAEPVRIRLGLLVGGIAAFDRAQHHVQPITLRQNDEVALGQWLVPVRWHEQIFASSAAVQSGRADIGDAHLPGVDHLPVEQGMSVGRWHVHYDRAVAQVEEGEDVGDLCVGSEQFVAGQRGVGERDHVVVADAVGLERAVAEEGHTDRGHSPDHCFQRSPVDPLLIPVLCGETRNSRKAMPSLAGSGNCNSSR